MAAEVFANNASTVLTAAVTTTPAVGTSETWTVQSTAAPFPQIGTAGTQQFRLTAGPTSDNSPEIVICTAINTATTLTVLRGAEGSPVKTHNSGDPIALTLTRDSLGNQQNIHDCLHWMG